MDDINDLIKNKLKEKNIETIGVSKYRSELKKFSEDNAWNSSRISQKLFSFLLENLMSRYLFNLMLRKTPNIESWPLNDKDFNEDNLKKYTFGESFIRIYKCHNCKHLLKRIYAPELYMIPGETLECPNCGIKKWVYTNYYESTFTIIKNDLANFIKKLRDINIIYANEYIICSDCGVELGAKDELTGLINCHRCGGKIHSIKRDEFKDPFLKFCQSESGLWFEWFIYEIIKQIYKNVEYGLNLSYVNHDKISKEKEVDLIALNDNKLILIECKNYLGHTPPREFETTIDIAPFFEEVYVINFYKSHKDVYKMINVARNIKLLNGDEIDNNFLNPKLIISQLLSEDVWFGNQIFTRISNGKKISVVEHIFRDFTNDMKRALIKILYNKSINEELFWKHFKERVEEILKIEIQIIFYHGKSGIFDIKDDLSLVAAYYFFFDSKQLSGIVDPIKILESVAGLNRLNDNYDSPVRGIYGSLFNCCSIKDINLSLADAIFDDLIHSYFKNYKWTDRDDTLGWIELIFEMISDTKINTFAELIKKEFKDSSFHTGTVADSMYRIFTKYENRFDKNNKEMIYNSAKYLHENGINDFVKDSARQFIEHIEKSTSKKI